MQNSTRIRIGNQTAFMASSPLEPFYYAVENRFDAFEWFPDKKETGAGWDIEDIPEETQRQIRETALSHNILLTVHVPWWTNPLAEEADTLLHNQIAFAKSIGANLLNIHLSVEAGIENFAEALIPVIKATHEAGLKLSVENTPVTLPGDFNWLFAWLQDRRDLPTEHVGMCLDLGHANLCNATRNDYIRYIDQLDAHVPIIHVHLHENYGDHDSHLPVFTGPSSENDAGIRAAMDRLAKRGFNGAIILEQWPEPQSLLNDARNRLLDMLVDYQPKPKPQPVAEKPARPAQIAVPDKTEVVVKEAPKAPQRPPQKAEAVAQEAPKEEKKPLKKAKAPKKAAVSAKVAEGKDLFIKDLVEMDHKRRSWREKLDGVCMLLADDSFAPTDENLIYLAIYLRFLGTGEVSCTEDGRHYRPSHHARMAQEITEKLTALTTPDNAFIMRKIYPWLPSYESAFTRAEPLTRIRDIAHRNDIPQELKKEIKHTLQNKLHRCAGPEDLETSARMLERITANQGEYPAPFVEQFQIFHKELQEFFNASSLDLRLSKLVNDELGEAAPRFLTAKKAHKRDARLQLETLERATELRALLIETADDDASAEAQNMRLADIGLEDYSFVLFSELITAVEQSKKVPWQLALTVLPLILKHLTLSGILLKQSEATAASLEALATDFDAGDRDQLLALKASLTRCLRLADTYTDLVLNLFFEKVEHLGRALKIDELAIKVYCEGDIRGNLIFQLSKIAALLIKHIRQALELPPWDVIVAGSASGKLVTARHLGDLKTSAKDELLVLLDEAEGDEAVPKGVAAIILPHDLPHLSHLAIRTRQDGVVLITGEDAAELEALQKRKGKKVTLSASAESVTFKQATARKKPTKKTAKRIALPGVELVAPSPLLELEQVSLTSGGGKAYGLQQLRSLSRMVDAGFTTPRGVVIPFGVMEQALSAAAPVRAQYDGLVERLAHLEGAEFVKTLKELSAIVSALPVPEKIVKSIVEKFPKNARLMVRSSSNSEDLETMAGAGLYESVANVAPARIAEAVRTVWASLWTERAALSRQQAAIPHDRAHMAVLIQEMITPDYSFIMHTVNPISRRKSEIYVELAVGLGEILASAAVRGTPYRMVLNKKTGALTMQAFADFSVALEPDQQGGVTTKAVDYSQIALTSDDEARKEFGKRLAAIGRFVELSYGQAQDIEGAVKGDTIILLQSRAQQGLR